MDMKLWIYSVQQESSRVNFLPTTEPISNVNVKKGKFAVRYHSTVEPLFMYSIGQK
jgi:hypothetical protein